MSKSTPAPPDYTSAAQAQAQASRELTDVQNHANRPTQNTPWGTTSWTNTAGTDPATGAPITNWTQNTTLNPQSQAALDGQLGIATDRTNIGSRLMDRVSGELSPPVNFDGFTPGGEIARVGDASERTPFSFGATPGGAQRNINTSGMQNVDPSARYAKAAGDAVYDQFSSRNEPLFARDRERNRTQLYNQGLKEGDAAYEDQMKTFDTGVSDARNDASYRATQAAGAEASRYHGMDLATRQQQFGEGSTNATLNNQGNAQDFSQGTTAANLNNNIRATQGQEDQQRFSQEQAAANQQNQQRQQQIAELLQQRGWSLNEVNALISGQQVGMPGMPGFNQAQRSETPQILGAAQAQYGAQMDAFNAQQAGLQGALSGAASLAPFAFSDRRLKRNIRRIGTVKGYPWYEFEYVWGEKSQGVMADEVPAHLTARHPSGYMMVNYDGL